MNTEMSTFIDQQSLKLQEAPEMIPTGEMPRTLLITCDRSLTDKCTPGNRVKIVGILSVMQPGGDNAQRGVPKRQKVTYI